MEGSKPEGGKVTGVGGGSSSLFKLTGLCGARPGERALLGVFAFFFFPCVNKALEFVFPNCFFLPIYLNPLSFPGVDNQSPGALLKREASHTL